MNNKQAKRLRKIALQYHVEAGTPSKKVYHELKRLFKKGDIQTK